MKTLSFFFLSILLLLCLGWGYLHTPWGKQALQAHLAHHLRQLGIELTLEGQSGIFPISLHFEHVRLVRGSEMVEMNGVHLRALSKLSIDELHDQNYSAKNLHIQTSLAWSWKSWYTLLFAPSQPLQPPLNGSLLFSAEYQATLWKGSAAYSIESIHSFKVWHCELKSDWMTVQGKGTLRLPLNMSTGTLHFSFPSIPSAIATLTLENQNLTGQASGIIEDISQFYSQAKGAARFSGSLGSGKAEFSLFAENVYWRDLHLDSLHVGGTHPLLSDSWDLLLDMDSTDNIPLHILSHARITKSEIDVFDFQAEVNHQNMTLQSPCTFAWQPLSLSPVTLAFSQGGKLSTQLEQGRASWEASHLPLEWLQVFFPSWRWQGTTSFSGFFNLTTAVQEQEGVLLLSLEEAWRQEDPLQVKGTLQAHLTHNILQLQMNLRAPHEQFLELTATLPTNSQEQPITGKLTAEGHIEEILDFMNFGPNRFSGLLSCELFLHGSLQKPALQGNILCSQGAYENYYTGTRLQEIEIRASAQGDLFLIESCHAQDPQGGTLSAKGEIKCAAPLFPYRFTCELANLKALDFDLLQSNFTGTLQMTGSSKGSLLQGPVLAEHARITPADPLPYQPPSLPLIFLHFPSLPHETSPSLHTTFPFRFDLDITTVDPVEVVGKGLQSRWKGTVHVKGENRDATAKGKLLLEEGEFLFSGKRFKLVSGEIIFKENPEPSAYISLSGVLTMADLEITAQLSGPLSSPQLTFQSNPHQPTSSILAHILFNKNIEEISQPEAVQLASVLMSLSGGAGPDILESIRKSLKVDRLTLGTAEGDSQAIAIQIGKYLTKGVLVTLSQSSTSTQVIVEVELKGGFVLQAETQEEEEGKFSLKWRHSY